MSNERAAVKERTRQLFAQLRDNPSARHELARLHMPLVEYLARRFQGRGEPLDDLIQVGSIGLLKAIDGFDPGRDIEFSTYATPTVIGEIKRHFRDHGWAIRIPRRLQELGLSISKTVPAMSQDLGRAPTVPEIAERLNASEEEILDAIEASRAYSPASLDAAVTEDSEARISRLGSEDESIELFEAWASVKVLLEKLPQRDRRVLQMRFVAGKTQTEIGRELGISQMHVSRLLAKALEFLRQEEKESE